MKLTKQILKKLIMEQMSGIQEAELPSENASEKVQAAFDSITGPNGPSQIAFITAENPPREKSADFEWSDSDMLGYLKMDLNGLGYNYYQIIGEYGGPENSLMIIGNPTTNDKMKEDMILLGKKYLQDSVIVGQKFKGTQLDPTKKHAMYRMKFDMIQLNPTKMGRPNLNTIDYDISETRSMVLTGPKIQARTEFYSEIDGKKFVIPFFSGEESHADEPMLNRYPVGR